MAPLEPLISAVVVAGSQRVRVGRALHSILSQDGMEQAEVVLVDSQRAAGPVPGGAHPAVRTVYPEDRGTFGDARALGVRQARGRYVAFLEDHSVALPGWLKAVGAALDGPWAGVGAEMHNGNAGVGISDAVWLMNYPPIWRPPARYGPCSGIPGHNSTYRRDVLMAMGGDLPALLQNEASLQWKLREQGYEVGIDPAIKVAHLSETSTIQLVRGYFAMHRNFGSVRARVCRWSLLSRVLRVLATPLVPAVRFVRFSYAALHDRPADVKTILRFAPVILVAQSAVALGMAVGYVLGPGDSGRKLLEFETSTERSSGA